VLCALQFVDVNPELDFNFGIQLYTMDGSTFASEPAKVVFFISNFVFNFKMGLKGLKA